MVWSTLMMVIALALAGCGMADIPLVGDWLASPPPTLTPTPPPTPTATSAPTQNPGAAAPAPGASPQVVIPADFNPVMDERLRYSFAVPEGWTELDLRSSQFRQVANLLGLGDQLASLDAFLNSPEGQMLGKLYITDLTSAMFGGLPTALVVLVADAPGYTAESAKTLVEDLLEANAGVLSDVQFETIEATTINNLPGVLGVGTANLAAVGTDARVFAKVIGLLANDKMHLMILVTEEGKRSEKEPTFDQIIGTFRPE
jgi:hypothetical protein